jgi:hypothetical protein
LYCKKHMIYIQFCERLTHKGLINCFRTNSILMHRHLPTFSLINTLVTGFWRRPVGAAHPRQHHESWLCQVHEPKKQFDNILSEPHDAEAGDAKVISEIRTKNAFVPLFISVLSVKVLMDVIQHGATYSYTRIVRFHAKTYVSLHKNLRILKINLFVPGLRRIVIGKR